MSPTDEQGKSREESLAGRERAEAALRVNAQLLDAVEQAVIVTDLSGTITYWNRYAEKLYGWSAAEAVGRNVMDVTPAGASHGQAAEIMSRLLEGKPWSGEFLVRRRDGTTFPAHVTDSPILDEEGKLVGVVGLSVDITERKRAEEALRDAERRAVREYETLLYRLTHLAESLGTARDHLTVFRDLKDFAIVSVPCIGIFISLYDAERDERTAQYAWGDGEEVDVKGLPPMPVTAEGPNSRAVRTGQVVITNDYWEKKKGKGQLGVLVGPDNDLRPQSSLIVPMATMGRIVGTIEVQSYDNHAFREEHVTAMRMAANLAAVAIENMRLLLHETRARENAEQINRLKDEFLATLSHELRTPLTAVLGWAQMLRTGRLDEKAAASAIEVIERNARTQQQIVDDLLDTSRIITGQLRFDPQPTDVRLVVESAADTVRPAATARSIKLETRFDARACLVMGDAGRLQQVIWNLLSNAVKFTPIGGEVTATVEPVGAHVRVRISDNGNGISQDFLPYVFDRFRQGDQSTTREYGGLGLGLAIVRHLVEMHGGTAKVASAGVGRGSDFTIELPQLRTADCGLRNEEQESGGVVNEESAIRNPQSAILKGLRVLIVDDERDALDLIKVVLEQGGAGVTAVESAAAAMEAFADSRPDVLVCDIGMPGEDGYQLLRRVRALGAERGGSVPAIALTAYAGEADRAAALAAGFRLHVPKPIDPATLVSAIAGLVGASEKV